MSFPSSHLIYHPILANNNTNVQQMPLQQPTQQQVHNLHNLFQQPQQQAKPIHVKVLVFETKKEDLSALETLKPTSIRRSERVLSNYADLTKYLTEKCGLTLDNALIRYQDDENHWVDISSDEELAYGIQLCRDSRTSAVRSVFRVAVILLKKEEEKPKQPEEEKRECPYWKGRRHGGCPFRRPRHNISENHPFMFRKTLDGENVLEVDIDVEKLKNGLNVNEFVRENIDKVQIPHFGVTCDGCGKYAFVGKRFKCDDCDDFDFCEDCFASENVRNAHFGGSHSFTEQQPRSACFLRNIFGAEKKEEETVIDNQLYEEQQPVVVEQPIVVAEEQPVVVEEPVVVPEPINVFQIPHPLNPVQQPIIEEPVVVQQPPIVQQPTPYQTELALLRDMGFVDEISNLTLLNKYNGDLQRVIVELIH